MRTLFSVGALLMTTVGCARQTITLTPDQARLQDLSIVTSRPTAGTIPLVTGFTNDRGRLTFQVNAAPGLYDARLLYQSDGPKEFTLSVNGLVQSASLDPSPSLSLSRPLRILLRSGPTDLSIGGGWGHYQVAALELTPVDPPAPPRLANPTPVDPDATPEARQLLTLLAHQYGQRTLSGVYDFPDANYVHQKTGVRPAILARDLIEYTPSRVERGSKPNHQTERLIQAHAGGYIISLCWHWNAPTDLLDKVTTDEHGHPKDLRWYRGFYTEATTFDFSEALADPASPNYALLLRDIDAIAVELRKLQDAHVPVLWRPLHEAEGKWFWWGARGPEAYKKLWRLLYARLTQHHHLHNLLWIASSGTDPAWYPGDDVVDIVGIDAYPKDVRDPLTQTWQTLVTQHGDNKLLALTEFGGVPDIDLAREHGVYWSFYTSWVGDLGPKKMPDEILRRLYSSPHVGNAQTP
jgi:mannan endo-1,4-beta-mannosidase